MTEKTIPLLPCHAVEPLVEFYVALGFEVTFQQKSPYPYVVVERGDVELQFFGMKGFDPAASYGACYVLTEEVDALFETFRAGLKAVYGKVPGRGLPRIGPLKDMAYDMRQFLLTDPSGNSIRVGQPIEGGDGHIKPAPPGTFERALHFATLFADSKEDLAGAARILDRVIGLRNEKPTPVQRVRILALRGDIAHRAGDAELAARMREEADELAALRLDPEGAELVRADLERLREVTGGD
ncbi:bleomycin resistance protein [Streptomyces boluensis]|uniref:VOC family protein n=1 Tax=Streptomyces boluensis TaxID=1775135 RepID=A0A964UN56_9ACTN|nr:VOC family protein [Streptomyces boluensis]NBE51260.1 VOC family protein [Streptomyces boluensis]